MAEPIRLSALGRDAQVGNLYNYFTDAILPSETDVPEEGKSTSDAAGKPTFSFFFQQPEKFKHQILGINSHLIESIKKGLPDSHEPWFANYTRANPKDDQAQVTVIFRLVRRTESLKSEWMDLQSKLNHHVRDCGRATHLVNEVVYGAEMICSMQRPLNLQQETKESAELSIYLAAKNYLSNYLVVGKSVSTDVPTELNDVSCTVLSSLKAVEQSEMSFQKFRQHLQTICSFEEHHRQTWQPIELLLFAIPSQLEVRLSLDRKTDFANELERHQLMWTQITELSDIIAANSSVSRFPMFEKVILYFCKILPSFRKKCDKPYEMWGKCPSEQALKDTRLLSCWLNDVIDWLANRRVEIETFSSLTGDTGLIALDRAEIENRTETMKKKNVKIFALQVEYREEHIIKCMAQVVGDQSAPVMLPILSSMWCGKKELESLRSALKEFAEKAQVIDGRPLEATSRYIQLVPSPSSADNDDIKMHTNFEQQPEIVTISPSSILKNSEQNQRTQMESTTPGSDQLKPLTGEETNVINQLPTSPYVETSTPRASEIEENISRTVKLRTNASESPDSIEQLTTCPPSSDQKRKLDGHEKGLTDHTEKNHYAKMTESESDSERNSKLPANETADLSGQQRRIAETFIDRGDTIIKKGPPDIYLLDVTATFIGNDIKWFDISRPGVSLLPIDHKNHKTIILMGATGSGKSTLINGMVNYILGVQWNDPFRFKCVRDDENVKNQANSQTSSVTAYTIRHQAGMTIPHSITIIDTPGYGDTRGIKRDKEITSNIHRFLTQQETGIDEIHAACFVAASGESRLTATQRYIIDSVLSIFGKDMKDNLRLLVTFADNADPPVVDACLCANFPVTSESDGLVYSKFNSSVLYCSNAKKEEDEFNVDELFWDMGQENFQKFFDMLVKMEGRNLTATREVIQRRQQLEQSLKDIECELEVCLVNIEEIEKFRLQLREYGHNMDANKNFTVERTEMRPVEVNCDKGLVAFNCKTCKKTCEKPSVCKSFKKRNCCSVSCTCPRSAHEIQPFTWIWRPAKVKITLNDMKAQFEANSNRKLSTEDLMANCSDELNIAKAKVLSLLDQVGANASSLDSTALRSNALNPAEYLSLMRSRVLEGQAPGYLTRLQTLTELQKSLTASAEKGLSTSSQVVSQPVKNAIVPCGRGSGILLQTSATGTAGVSESKPDYSGRKGRDETPSRSSQTSHSGSPLGTALTVTGSVNRNHIQNNISGCNANGTAPMMASGRGRSRGRDQSNPTDTAAIVIHGDGNQWKHPLGDPEDYYRSGAKTLKKPYAAKVDDSQNPDGSTDSPTDSSSFAQGKSGEGNESKGKLADDKESYSSDDEADQRKETKEIENKSEGFMAAACRSLSKLWKNK